MNKIKYLLIFALLLQICFAFSQNVSVRFADLTNSPLTQAALNTECQAQFGQDYTNTFPTTANRWRYQWYKDGGDNIISPLDAFGQPTGDDIEAIGVVNPGNTTGTVSLAPTQAWLPSAATFPPLLGGSANTKCGDKVYIRIFNAGTIANSTKYMCFTSLYTITTIAIQVNQPYIPAYAWGPWTMIPPPPPNPVVALTSTPDYADIFADGIDTGYNTPHTFTLNAGSNVTYTVAKAGYTWTPAALEVTNIQTNISQNFAGSLLTYTVEITSNPVDADIFAGGVDSGYNTPHTFTLTYGSSVIYAVAKSGYNWTPAASAINNITANTSLNFTGSQIPNYTVDITSTPDNADILANGTDTGFNTPHTFTLIEGSNVTYTLAKTGYSWSPASLVINNITANTSQSFVGSLMTYTVSITSNPDGANIYADQVYTGFTTPHTFTLNAGCNATYTVTKLSYNNWNPASFVVNNIQANTSRNFVGSPITSGNAAVNFRDVTSPATPLTQAALNPECQAQFGQDYTFTYPLAANRWRYQWYKDGGDNVISPLDAFGHPTGDDIEAIGVINPGNTSGTVALGPTQCWGPSAATFADEGGAGNTHKGDKVYIRIFNASTIAAATKYISFTSLYTITNLSTQVIQPYIPAYAWTPWISGAWTPTPTYTVAITSIPDNADILAGGIDTGFNTPHTFTLSEGSSVTYTVAKTGYNWTPSSCVINNIMANISQNFTGSQIAGGPPVAVTFRDTSTQTKTLVNQEFGYSTSYPNGYPYPTPSTGFNKWLIQFYTSLDNIIDPLDANGNPTGDDAEVIAQNGFTQYLGFSPTGGVVLNGCIIASSGSQFNTWIGSKIYIRIFNSNTKAGATKSISLASLYTVTSAGLQMVNILPTYAWTPWAAYSSLATCTVNITSTPTDADIYADLVDTGFNTPHTFRLAAGSSVTYTVVKPDYAWAPASLAINNIAANTSQNFIGTQTIIPGEPTPIIPPGNVLIASVSLETPGSTSFDIDCTVLNINELAQVPPNGGLSDENSYAIVLNATSGTADILISVPAGTWWICGYWDGNWHEATPYPYSNPFPGSVTLYGVPFGAKGEVPVVISEGAGVDPTLPVTLSSFTATVASQSYVNLTWVTESETQVLGYNVHRSMDRSMGNSIKLNQFIIPATNTSERQSYTLNDSDGLQANLTYYYWLENVDMGGVNNLFGPVSATITGQNTPDIPVLTSLGNAYPNPIRTSDAVNIDVNVKAGETGTVNIYNVRGQLVKYYNVKQGEHKLTWDTSGSGSGIYFYRLSTPTVNTIKKLVILN